MVNLRANSLFCSLLGLAAATSLGLAGCGDDGGGGGTGGPDPIDINPAGTHTQFVINDLTIPASATESKALALDIDGDGETENALGGLLGALASTADLDLQTGVDEQIANASFILLASIKATGITDADGVGTYIYFGENAAPAACTDDQDLVCGKHFTGSATFDIAANSPSDSVLAGTLAGGELTTNPGKVTIELPLGDIAPLQIELIGARIQANVSATGIAEGRIAGAITDDDVNTKVIPSVAVLIGGIIEDDCPDAVPGACDCVASSSGASVLGFFDGGYTVNDELVGKDDCKVDEEELRQNSLIGATLLNPDLDLLDATGAYNPNSDGIVDSLSLALGFTAVNGVFTLPAGI